MTPLTTLYDNYIDRPDLIGHKKPVVHIVPTPTIWF